MDEPEGASNEDVPVTEAASRKRPLAGADAARADKKRKVVVLCGYVGAGFAGMQRNPGVTTIVRPLLLTPPLASAPCACFCE